MSTLGSYLRKKREDRGLTQSEVAQHLGYGSPQFISNIERGISSLPIKSLKPIIKLYQISADEIIDVLLSERREFLLRHLEGENSGSEHTENGEPNNGSGGRRPPQPDVTL